MLLEIDNITLQYGRIQALHGISLAVDEGEIVALIGGNGAGKTTTMRAVSGLRPVASGRIRFAGQDITNLRADLRVIRGISQAPEGRGIFPGMTVLENLEMGAYRVRDQAQIRNDIERGFNLFPRLRERLRQRSGTLSGGEQQMLAIARALMSRPKLLLLDEPSLGLAPIVCHTIFTTIDEIKATGTTVLLVEQNANAALKHSDRGYVLETGAVTLEGSAASIAGDPRIREAYLGES